MTDETLMLRQVHPSFMKEDRPASSAFSPTPKDHGQLSVDHGDLISAEESYKRYTEVQHLPSEGVWAVSAMEARETETPAAPSPLAANPAHCHLDFTAHGRNKQRKLAKVLRSHAVTRGRLYPDSD